MADFKKTGDKFFKKGMENITTGLFNWSKDYVSAATEFEQALDNYKKAQSYQDCLKTIQQLLKCNEKNRDQWAVARNYELMMEIYTDKKIEIPDEQYLKLTHETFIAFRLANSTDKGLKVIKNSAQYLIKRKKQEAAINLLKECYQQALSDEKCYSQNDIFNMMIELLLEMEAYPNVIELYKQKIATEKAAAKTHLEQVDSCQTQYALIVVIISILQRNIAQAESDNMQFMADLPNYACSSECESATNLINAFAKFEVEKFKKETTRASVTTIYPMTIIKKLRELKLVAPAVIQGATGPNNTQSDEQKKMLEQLFF